MIPKNIFKKVSPVLWEIPRAYRNDMRVPARVYASERMLEDITRDHSLEQIVNVTTLPGIVGSAIAMPDIHEGYGFPIGGVAAMTMLDGVISPGGIGYDINCGVRLLVSELRFSDLKEKLESIARELYRAVPSGVGKSGKVKLGEQELDDVLRDGIAWAVRKDYADADDAQHIESEGTLVHADPTKVSQHAKTRGRDQLGTMGAGNHFVEVDRVEEVFDKGRGKIFGLSKDIIVILIHCGSRGLGHQVATDYIRTFLKKMPEYGVSVPDRQLACVPFSAKEGKDYFAAMAAAANFAWVNRQLITWEVRRAWQELFGDRSRLRILYDVAHNIAKLEEHEVNGAEQQLIVHRKGATRAFPPGHEELRGEFRATGQPVLIPGSMGTASYVLVGTEEAMRQSFGSSCHGAGRRMSRTAAKREVHGRKLRDALRAEGIVIESGSLSGLAEEAPIAYKDIHEVVDVVEAAGIAKRVARLKPIVVVKG